MENKVVKTMIGAVALSNIALAGPVEEIVIIEEKTVVNEGNFFERLSDAAVLYKDKSNPFIQEVKLFGRAHVQYANVNGENGDGDDFGDSFEEVRRLRAGAKIKAFNGFEALARANFISDNSPRGGDRDLEFTTFDEAYVRYNFGTVAGVDDLKLSYGRFKIALSGEGQQSSKKIKTVERSAISNKVFTNRYTSFLLSGSRGNVDATLGFLSLDDSDFIGNFSRGHAIYFDTDVELGGHDYNFNALYNLDEGSDRDEVGMDFKYAASLDTTRNIAGWNVLFNAVFGDNGDNGGSETGGEFWGFVVLPTKYIVEDKVEAVFRYAYQGSSRDQGIGVTRRYFGQSLRNQTITDTDLDGTSSAQLGDQHHSIYAGLNYYFAGDQSKIMAGVEYENLSTPIGNADGTTLWLAYRTFF